MDKSGLIEIVAKFVKKLLKDELDPHLYFHNENHTRYVVDAVLEIGKNTDLTEEELIVVQIAAWFHDVGYTKKYKGHEEVSIIIAQQFLKELKIDLVFINSVVSCIAATAYPQAPKNKMEMVICDADFYHLARQDYNKFESALRLEWEEFLHIVYQDQEWNQMNLNMLTSHTYCTAYGKEKLQILKAINIRKLLKKIH